MIFEGISSTKCKMETYTQEYILNDTIVFNPKFLERGKIKHTIIQMITDKYKNGIFKNEGFLFLVKDDVQILSDIITPVGQIVLNVQFRAMMYKPQVGQTFDCQIFPGKFYCEIKGPVSPLIVCIPKDSKLSGLKKIKLTGVKKDNISLCFGTVIDVINEWIL